MHTPTSAPPRRRRRSHTVVVLFFTSPCGARAPLRPGAAGRGQPARMLGPRARLGLLRLALERLSSVVEFPVTVFWLDLG